MLKEPYDQEREATRDAGVDFVQWSVDEANRLVAMTDEQLLACHRSSGRMLVDRGYVVDDDRGPEMLGIVFLVVFAVLCGWIFGPLGDALIRVVFGVTR
jgi:hypothetical protein